MAIPSGAALELVQSALLNEMFDTLEEAAKERGINAQPVDDETRRIAAMQVRAIRSVRSDLETLAKGKDNAFEPDAVA